MMVDRRGGLNRKPPYKFRLLCKRCNSYRHTTLAPVYDVGGEKHGQIIYLMLHCAHCDVSAKSLDEAFPDD